MKRAFIHKGIFYLLCSSACIYADFASAGDEIDALLSMDIEQLSKVAATAGFFDSTPSLTPGTQFLLDFEDIDQFGSARTVGEAINSYARGMTVSNHVEYGPQIGVRGVLIDNNSKTPVMWDGQVLSQRSHFGYTTSLASPLIGDMRAAEVSLSPNTLVLGGGAINGYINMIPKNGTDNQGVYANVEYGLVDNLRSAESGYGYNYGKGKDIYVYAGVVDADGFTPDSLLGETLGNTADYDVNAGTVRGFGDATYRLSTYWRHKDLTISTIFDKTTPQNNSIGDGSADGVWFNEDYFEHRLLASSAKYLYQLAENHTVDFRLYGELHDYGGQDAQSFRITPMDDVNEGGSESHGEAKIVYRNTAFDGHSLALGGSYGVRGFNLNDKYFTESSDTARESVNFRMTEAALFGEDSYKLTDKITLIAGLRYDKIEYGTLTDTLIEGRGPGYVSRALEGEDNIAPRVGLAWEANDTTDVTIGYQEGFRTPDAKFLARDIQWDEVVPNAGIALKPEKVDNYQIDIEKRFPDQKLTTNYSLFYNRYTNLIRWDDFENNGTDQHGISADFISQMFAEQGWFGQFINADTPFGALGGELFAEWKPTEEWVLRGSYSYSHLAGEPDTNWERMADHNVKLNIRRYFMEKKLSLDANLLWNNSFDLDHLNTSGSVVRPRYGNERLVFDIASTYQITPGLSVKGTIQNLFKNNVPVMNERPDNLKNGLIGTDERLFYLAVTAKF